jgi:hypothetical protein
MRGRAVCLLASAVLMAGAIAVSTAPPAAAAQKVSRRYATTDPNRIPTGPSTQQLNQVRVAIAKQWNGVCNKDIKFVYLRSRLSTPELNDYDSTNDYSGRSFSQTGQLAYAYVGAGVGKGPAGSYCKIYLDQKALSARQSYVYTDHKRYYWNYFMLGAFCQVAVHEGGHLNNFRDRLGAPTKGGKRDKYHSPEIANVMYPYSVGQKTNAMQGCL